MALPALERLREGRPAARVSLLTAEKLADLFTGHPAIDEVLAFRKEDSVLTVARRLRLNFDLAVILPNSFRSALESFLARIPARVGYPGNGRQFLLTRSISRRTDEGRMHKRSDAAVRRLINQEPQRPRDAFPERAHHLHNYLHLVAALGCNPAPLRPRIVVAEIERAAVRAKFNLSPSRNFLGLNPGAEYGPAKRWPAERFIKAAQLALPTFDGDWLIFGGPADRATAAEIATALGPRARNLAGQTSLRELCAALSLCRAVLTNDTGPMHLAAAVGASVVVPFGSTSPELTGPGSPGGAGHALIPGQAPCAPCFRRTCPVDFRCMLSIQPERLAQSLSAIVSAKDLS